MHSLHRPPRYGAFIGLCFGLSLVACGDDDSSSGTDENVKKGVAEYETTDDMVHCTKSHYGEIAYVVETDSVYECTSEGWVATDSSKIDALNSSDSKSGDSDGKSSAGAKSSGSEKADAADTAKVKTVKVDSVTVKGVAEKGPFAKGSAVTVYGLDSAFNKTKKSFKGSVTDDKGNYVVSGITLESQYALVEVNGFFMNEVTGKVTTGAKTKLSALVDLSKGGTVKANVNVLTPLEMSRAVYLVQNEKYNVPAAKKRATREILSVFGFGVDSVAATELTLSGEGDATNALFAASVALIGDLSLSKFNTRLTDFAESFAATGKMDDTLRAAIADNLSHMDSANVLYEVGKTIKAMNSKATDIEEMLYEFWYNEYGLPVCDDKNEETQEKNKNKLSDDYGAGYACTSKHWHKSTALDTELGLCIGDAEGSYKESKAKKYYTCKSGQWREITSLQYELKECTDDIAKDDSKKYRSVDDKKFFLCKDKQWEELNADEYELKDCGEDNDQKVVTTKTENSYVCEDGSWREASRQEAELGYCAKVDSTKFEKLGNDYYVCLDEGWTEVDDVTAELGFCTKEDSTKFESLGENFYVCLADGWSKVSALVAELGFCTDKAERFKTAKSGDVYACVENSWVKSNEKTMAVGEICNSENSGEFETVKVGDFDGNYACLDGDWVKCEASNNLFVDVSHAVVCEEFVWRKAGVGEVETGKICRDEDLYNVNAGYSCVRNSPQEYLWRKASDEEVQTKFVCSSKTQNRVVAGYTCKLESNRYSWKVASDGEKATGVVCSSSNVYDVVEGYVCENSAWREANSFEVLTEAVCGKSFATGMVKLGTNNTYYSCVYERNSYNWRKSSAGEIATKRVCSQYEENLDSVAVNAGYTCVAATNGYEWRTSTPGELATGVVCSKSNVNTVNVTKGYTCVDSTIGYTWRKVATGEKETGKVCLANSSLEYVVRNGYACDMYNGMFSWRTATSDENLTKLVCTAKNELVDDYPNKMLCVRSGGAYLWRKQTAVEQQVGICGQETRPEGYLVYYSPERLYSNATRYKCDNKEWVKYTVPTMTLNGNTYKVAYFYSLTWMAEDMRNSLSSYVTYCKDGSLGTCSTTLYSYDAAVKACSDIGTGWRLPYRSEANALIGRKDAYWEPTFVTPEMWDPSGRTSGFVPRVNASGLSLNSTGYRYYNSYNNKYGITDTAMGYYWLNDQYVLEVRMSEVFVVCKQKECQGDNIAYAAAAVRCVKDN